MMRTAVLVLALVLAASGPGEAVADPNPQLVASVQRKLNSLGFQDVDATRLSTRQVAALHMQLQGGTTSFGRNYLQTRQRVKSILRWDPPAPAS
jgi:hypothetical protein